MRWFLVFTFILFPLHVQAQTKIHTQSEYIMGTLFTIKIQSKEDPGQYFDEAFRIIRDYDQILSDYRDDSERSQLMQREPRQKSPLSPRFCKALLWSQYFSVLTDGAFDITLGPLMRLWGVRSQTQVKPQVWDIEQTLKNTGYSKIDPTNCYFQRQSHAVEMDFGAIGKGLALDAAVSRLKQMGVKIAALDAGQSTQYFLGAPEASQGWPVRFRSQNSMKTFYLRNQAISSSGDGQQGFEIEGEKFSHIINPKTGFPLRSQHSVAVIADNAMTADAMSTALMVLPQARGGYYERLLNIQIIYISGDL